MSEGEEIKEITPENEVPDEINNTSPPAGSNEPSPVEAPDTSPPNETPEQVENPPELSNPHQENREPSGEHPEEGEGEGEEEAYEQPEGEHHEGEGEGEPEHVEEFKDNVGGIKFVDGYELAPEQNAMF